MMPAIQMGRTTPVHQLKFCTKCQENRPPEGGVEMGVKWHCQLCWVKKIQRQNAKTKAT
jgi:hypothetical protein